MNPVFSIRKSRNVKSIFEKLNGLPSGAWLNYAESISTIDPVQWCWSSNQVMKEFLIIDEISSCGVVFLLLLYLILFIHLWWYLPRMGEGIAKAWMVVGIQKHATCSLTLHFNFNPLWYLFQPFPSLNTMIYYLSCFLSNKPCLNCGIGAQVSWRAQVSNTKKS